MCLLIKKKYDAIWLNKTKKRLFLPKTNIDIVFSIDMSSSMNDNDPEDTRKMVMSRIISSLDKNDNAGVVLFRSDAFRLNENLSLSKISKKKLISDIFNQSNDNGENSYSGTNGSLGLYTAINFFKEESTARKYIVFLTDGEDTKKSFEYSEIVKLANERDITIITIGLGAMQNSELLSYIAEETSGNFYTVEDTRGFFDTYLKVKADVAKDVEFDSNLDGISDYFTNQIIEGKITTSTGLNPFENATYADIQSNNDYDNDGILNGEEIKIAAMNDKVYLKFKSYPTRLDSDYDGLQDDYDMYPLKVFDPRFILVENNSYRPKTPIEDEFEKESNKVYNKQKNNSNSKLNRVYKLANFQSNALEGMRAAEALKHFLSNSGNTYNFDNDSSFLETYNAKKHFSKNINSLLELGETTVKNNSTLCFSTNVEFTGSTFSDSLDDLSSIGWWYAVGSTRANMVGTISNKSNKYTLDLLYYIEDFYDWNKNAGVVSGFGGLVNDADMFKLHNYGMAKQ
jgi:hypothetical protein